jgi:hypothetical protein
LSPKEDPVSYAESVREVVTAHLEELEGDLDLARHELRQGRGRVVELERRVAGLEALIAMAEPSATGDGRDIAPGTTTLHDAMAEVLRDAPGQMLRAADVASEVDRRRLYRMRDGRPVEPQQIHARVGHYPHLFRREGTFIKLVD